MARLGRSQSFPAVISQGKPVSYDRSGTSALTGFGALVAAILKAALATSLITGFGSTAAVAQKNASGSASISGSGAITASGGPSASGSASLTSFGSTAATGQKGGLTTLSVTDSGSVIAVGTAARAGTSAVSDSGTLATFASKQTSGSSSASSSGSIAAAISKGGQSASASSGSGSVNGSGQHGGTDSATLSGSGSIAASIAKGGQSASTASTSGAVAAAGVAGRAGASAVTDFGSISAAGTKQAFSASTLSGSGEVTSTGIAGEPEQHSGTSAVTVSGATSATGEKEAFSAGSESGSGSTSSAGERGTLSAAAASGSGAVTANGAKTGSAAAALSTSGELTASTQKGGQSSAAISIFGTIAAVGERGGLATSTIDGTGSVTAAGSKQAYSTTAVTGFGAIVSEGSILEVHSGACAISGFGANSALGAKQAQSASTVSGSGNIVETDTTWHGGAAAVSGFGSIVAIGTRDAEGTASVSGSGIPRAAGEKGYTLSFIEWLAAPAKDIGRRCLIAEIAVRSSDTEITRYLSTTGYTSTPNDTPANQLYTGRISGGMQFTRRLDLNGSGGSISFGDIELDNEDGALDGYLSDIWAGRTISLYLGEAGDAAKGIAKWPKSQFELVFAGTIDDITPKARNRLSLKVRDTFGPLNDTFSTATVGGTGDNKDALRPVTLGECFNVTPVLINAATQTYAIHLAAAHERVIEVRDNGVPVAGTQYTAVGTFALTNARYGQITADVQGAKINGEWRNDAGGLIEWVATVLGDGNFIAPSQIDITALRAFREACPQPLGLYVTDRGNRLAIMRQLAASIGATVTTRYDGKLILVRVGFGTPVGSIGVRQMIDGTFGPLLRPPVTGAVRLNAERNWTPQPTGLAGSLTAEQLPILGDEYVVIADADSTVLANWNQNGTPPATETLMVRESDVTAETARRLALWKVKRTLFGFEGFAELLQYEIGNTVTLTHPRFGLSGGAPAQIVGIQNDWIAARVRLEVLV